MWLRRGDTWSQLPALDQTFAELACGEHLYARTAGDGATPVWYARDGRWIDTDVVDGDPTRAEALAITSADGGAAFALHVLLRRLDGLLSASKIEVSPVDGWLRTTAGAVWVVEPHVCPQQLTRVDLATGGAHTFVPAPRNERVCAHARITALAVAPDGTVMTGHRDGIVVRRDDGFDRVWNGRVLALAAIRDGAVFAQTPDGVIELVWPAK